MPAVMMVRLVALIAAAFLLAPVARAQESAPGPTETAPTTTPTTVPASQPAAPVNHLRSPHELITRFTATAEAADESDDYSAAMACLDFGPLAEDQEQVAHTGPRYVQALYEILQGLERAGHFDPTDEAQLPRDPAANSPHSIGKPPLVLVLKRIEVPGADDAPAMQKWKFSWPTVETSLDRAENLAANLREIEQQRVDGQLREELRTPRSTITFFLDKAAAVEKAKDPNQFQAAMDCLDFSAVLEQRELKTPEQVQKFRDDEGTRYILGLNRILEVLLASGDLAIENVPDELDPERKPMYALGNKERVGAVPLELLLVRAGDPANGTAQWQFSADTVQRVPQMVKALDEAAAAELEEAADEPKGPEPIREETRSARATLDTFISAMKENRLRDAVACMDTSNLTAAELELVDRWAGKLYMVLARRERPLLQTVPDDPGATEPYELLAHRAGRVAIGPTYDDQGRVAWLFTRRTVGSIEPLYEEFQDRPLHEDWHDQRLSFWTLPALYVREYMVPAGLKQVIWGLRVWQWIGVPAVLVGGWLVFLICQLFFPPIVRRMLRSDGLEMLPRAVRRALRPAAALLMVLTWWGGLLLLDLEAALMTPTFWLLRVLITIVAAIAFYRLVDIIMNWLLARAARSKSRVDDVLVPLADRTIKIVIIALGFIFLLNATFGVDVWRLLAGLGVGGIAVAFAAQDTIKNFFGSVNVVLDRPFQVGDWVRINDTEGIIESVGLRSSKIRTFWKSQISIPNAEIMNATIENFQRRNYRRTYAIVSVTYSTTPEQLEAFCEGIRELVRQHEHTWKDYFHVYVKEFAASSIDIMVYCFHDVNDWGKELAERHRLILDIIRLARRLDVEFAFPTQTLHVYRERHSDEQPPVPDEPTGAISFGKAEADKLLAELRESGGARKKS